MGDNIEPFAEPTGDRVSGQGCDILLIPPVLNPFFSEAVQQFMPLGLLAVAATLRQAGFHPQIYKPHRRLLTGDDFRSAAADILEKKPLIVGFSTWCITYPSSLLVAQQIKAIDPSIPVVFGGPQASLLGHETLAEFGFVDYILAGEADYSLPQLVNSLLNGCRLDELTQIPGLVFREKGEILQSKRPAYIADLNNLPIPAYDMVETGKIMKLDVGRGCPYKCTYCSTNNFFSKKYRTKSAARILDEMNRAFEQHGITMFSFAHDLFTLNKTFILDFCSKMVQAGKLSKRNYTWTCSARIDAVSEEMLKAMKSAGCEAIFFGIESGSAKMQRLMKKNLNVEAAYPVAVICKKLGIEMHASFISGFPGETIEDIEQTLQSMLKLAAIGSYVQISELSVLPGTSIFEEHHRHLRFDGRFSGFSGCICSMDEIALIVKYPRIFSSFYYLPGGPFDRETTHMLCHFINHLSDFKNSLILLGNSLVNDSHPLKLTGLFMKIFPAFRSHIHTGLPPETYIVRVIEEYINALEQDTLPPYTKDVFAFEATKALLTAKFSRMQLLNPGEALLPFINSPGSGRSVDVKNLVWRMLTTSYKLEAVLPSRKKRDQRKTKTVQGHNIYLVMAVSEKKCIHFTLNKQEAELFRNSQTLNDSNPNYGALEVAKALDLISLKRKIVKNGIWRPK